MEPHPQPEQTRNTRRYPRYELETELRAVVFATEHREVRGRALDINLGGIAGLFVSGWQEGTSVTLQFSVPVVTAPVCVRAILRNCTGHRYGFEFANLSTDECELIRRTCATLALLQ
jgi:hypothetical protein